jgi:hypothetical protein
MKYNYKVVWRHSYEPNAAEDVLIHEDFGRLVFDYVRNLGITALVASGAMWMHYGNGATLPWHLVGATVLYVLTLVLTLVNELNAMVRLNKLKPSYWVSIPIGIVHLFAYVPLLLFLTR